MNIEKEIQARVDFKMNEILTAVKNTAESNWNTAFRSNSQKHSHFWEAFKQLRAMLIKEMEMSTPFDDMAERKRLIKKDEVIEKIMERFCKRGETDYHHKKRLLVSIIEDAQNW